MLTAVILICVAGAADCTRDTAGSVLVVPGSIANPVTCFLHGQAYLAGSSIGRDLRSGERVKVICARS